ncbi:hypothetical protein [Sphingomonas turrisvirgatae]|uniref:Lipoprotein n=1 Tax=Sphingomonas turrisvirgatae TaxID=1888892 RepID=A0A1E3LSG4_9SPHN|nr:hypothetical protein [Sphingomonas turrisvirgatae]ODP36691.1 hypothetical protein BFL28_05155 [Sphingomonas turrisvirgatae]
MRHLLALSSLAVLAACVAPSAPPPAPAPRPAPPPAPVPAPAPPAASSDWRDWPLTPGNWSYRREGQGSVAVYSAAAPVFTIRCEAGRLSLIRSGSSGPLTLRTTSSERTVTGALPASDRLIDAMGFSRGRFIVETPGAPPLVVPAHAEVLRVAEDCRR